jgi:hypothetical protein
MPEDKSICVNACNDIGALLDDVREELFFKLLLFILGIAVIILIIIFFHFDFERKLSLENLIAVFSGLAEIKFFSEYRDLRKKKRRVKKVFQEIKSHYNHMDPDECEQRICQIIQRVIKVGE